MYPSTVEKRAKESNSPVVTSPGDEDQVMAALNLSEGVAEKFDLILAKLCSLDSKMKDLNTTVKVYKVSYLSWKLILSPLRTSRRIWMKSSLTWKLIPNLLMSALANFKAVWKSKAPWAAHGWIDQSQVYFFPCGKTGLCAKLFVWKYMSPVYSFAQKSSLFHMKHLAQALVLKKRQMATHRWKYSLHMCQAAH